LQPAARMVRSSTNRAYSPPSPVRTTGWRWGELIGPDKTLEGCMKSGASGGFVRAYKDNTHQFLSRRRTRRRCCFSPSVSARFGPPSEWHLDLHNPLQPRRLRRRPASPWGVSERAPVRDRLRTRAQRDDRGVLILETDVSGSSRNRPKRNSRKSLRTSTCHSPTTPKHAASRARDRTIATSTAWEIAPAGRARCPPGAGRPRPALWCSSTLGPTTSAGLVPCCRGCQSCAVGYEGRGRCAFQRVLMRQESSGLGVHLLTDQRIARRTANSTSKAGVRLLMRNAHWPESLSRQRGAAISSHARRLI
jgi:hypothetical protein